MWVHDTNVGASVLAGVCLQGDLHEKSPGTALWQAQLKSTLCSRARLHWITFVSMKYKSYKAWPEFWNEPGRMSYVELTISILHW